MWTPEIIKQVARDLRKNQTLAEKIFWDFFRRKTWNYKVYRQKPIPVCIDNNDFQRYIIADFYFPQARLIIEIDWDVHKNKDIYLLDREKEQLLHAQWYDVIRFTNDTILSNMDFVETTIAFSLS